jgi:hypothetical protein
MYVQTHRIAYNVKRFHVALLATTRRKLLDRNQSHSRHKTALLSCITKRGYLRETNRFIDRLGHQHVCLLFYQGRTYISTSLTYFKQCSVIN